MERCEILKEAYVNEIQSLINNYKDKSVELRKQGAGDEAILENIKVNVIDIFSKMFQISYDKVCNGKDEDDIKLDNLYETYLAYFDRIPRSWIEKREKDKEHGMMKEYYIEQIKLDTADMVKNLFLDHYNKICEDE